MVMTSKNTQLDEPNGVELITSNSGCYLLSYRVNLEGSSGDQSTRCPLHLQGLDFETPRLLSAGLGTP